MVATTAVPVTVTAVMSGTAMAVDPTVVVVEMGTDAAMLVVVVVDLATEATASPATAAGAAVPASALIAAEVAVEASDRDGAAAISSCFIQSNSNKYRSMLRVLAYVNLCVCWGDK